MSEFREMPVFRFHREVPVRFGDLDPMGHVHHSVALLYFEDARAAYWREVAGRLTVPDIDYVIGEVRVRYHERIMYPDVIRVGVRVSRIGGKSVQMEYEVRSEAGVLLVSGGTTHVMFDFATGESTMVKEELREKLQKFEGGEGTKAP
jgi:acyl-CoA thioester hydrolase